MGRLEETPPPPLLFLSPPSSPTSDLDSKISPSILLIIIILAIIFFVSGLLHLLVRCLLRPTIRIRDPDDLDPDPTALQGQLRQLFHLHDGGVDQSFIDTLPVFPYKAIVGVKDPFDCAVCLCEFEADDKLRLLPKCSHAFHVDCIDTWLLSHSTCPLCRFSLLNGQFSNGDTGMGMGMNPIAFPFVCVLESSRDMGDSVPESDSHAGTEADVGFGSGRASDLDLEGRIVTVKLGKFRNVDGGEGSSTEDNDNNKCNNGNLGSRRCFSMGSFAYVMDETTSLQVPIRTPAKKASGKKKVLYLAAKSENGSDSMRNGNVSGRSKREGFSISKIWMRGGKGKKENGSSRRTISEIGSSSVLGIGIEDSQRFGGDEETQSCCSVESLATNPRSSTSTKTTLLWLMGRNNKIVHNHSSSLSSNA